MKKILFSDKYGLTQAVLKLRKKNTRRQEKSLDNAIEKYEETYKTPFSIINQYYDSGLERFVLRTPNEPIYIKPRYLRGEVVAVAQAYRDIRDIIGDVHEGKSIKFMAGWNNKLFVRADLMPSRIGITNVRAERLQDISDEDCISEGVFMDEIAPPCYQPFYTFPGSIDHDTQVGYKTPREAFADLIDKVSGKGTWNANPWVIVYEFELVK